MDPCPSLLWTDPFVVKEVFGLFLFLPCFSEIQVFYAKSVDPDQTQRSATSDLRIHCLPMSLLLDIRHKWVFPTKSQSSLHMRDMNLRCPHEENLHLGYPKSAQ